MGLVRISAALTFVLLALALVACGGDGDSTSTAAQATSGQGGEVEAIPPGGGKSEPEEGEGTGGSSKTNGSGSTGGSGSGGSNSSAAVAPLRVSGGGSDQFRTEGGDNSIEEFGEEGDESELQEAAEAVHDFFAARVAEEWTRACSYLAAPVVEQLERLVAQSSRQGCAPALDALTRPVPAALQREITTIDAGSLRQDGEQAFLIYHGAGDTAYAMPLRQEDGEWKVGALGGSAQL